MQRGLGEAIVSPKTLASPVGVRKFVFNVRARLAMLASFNIQ